MAIEYAAKYSGKVDERFAIASKTNNGVNNDYEFTGVDTVKVYSIPTVALGDYSMSGTNRYGTPAELQNAAQTMLLSQDKAFTFIIDKKSEDDTEGAMQAGKALRRQVDEVIIPTVDKYRLAAMAAGAGKTATAAISASNAFSSLLDGANALSEAGVPETGRVAYVSPNFYKNIHLDGNFVKSGDLSQEMMARGIMGTVAGVQIVMVPTTYLPTNVEFIMEHPAAVVSPIKLESYKIHDNPPGINGKLVEGRIRYDAFVLDSKKNAVYVHKKA